MTTSPKKKAAAKKSPAPAKTPAAAPAAPAAEVLAYCMTCKQKRPMKDPKEKTLANGRKALTGACATCGQKLFLFVKS